MGTAGESGGGQEDAPGGYYWSLGGIVTVLRKESVLTGGFIVPFLLGVKMGVSI